MVAATRGVLQRISPTLATIGMVALAVCFLYWARPVLIPTALTILLTFLLGPVVLFVQRRGVSRVPAVLLVVTTTWLILGLLVWLFVTQTLQLANELPQYQASATKRIEEIRSSGSSSLLSKVQSFADRVSEAMTKPDKNSITPTTERPQPVVLVNNNETWVTPLLLGVSPLIEPLASAGLVLILLIYTLIERESLRDRLLRLIGRGHMPLTTVALDDAGQRISRYLLAQFMINACYGVLMAVALWVIGVPHAMLWGIFSAFLRYIPFIGPWIAAILPLSLSLLTANGWLQPILVVLLFTTFEIACNLIIEPWLYGQTMGVSQSSLLFAIAFWTWLWGPMGLVLAAPFTVCLMILGRYVPSLKFFDILLGDEQPLTADLRFYQRLLAHNEDEASQIAHEQLKTLSLQQVYDQVVIPALTYARQDVETGRLAERDAEVIYQLSGEIAEELELFSVTSHSQPSPEETARAIAPLPPRVRILACAARDAADEAALRMFQRLLDPAIGDLKTASTDRLASEIVSQVQQDRPSIVCIAALPPGGVAHTRLLCKRLRQKFPKLKILVGRWGLRTDITANCEELLSAGADLIGTSLEETTGQLVQLVQFLRPTATSDSDESTNDESTAENSGTETAPTEDALSAKSSS